MGQSLGAGCDFLHEKPVSPKVKQATEATFFSNSPEGLKLAFRGHDSCVLRYHILRQVASC